MKLGPLGMVMTVGPTSDIHEGLDGFEGDCRYLADSLKLR